jgi:Family of unknown function (DUF6490)
MVSPKDKSCSWLMAVGFCLLIFESVIMAIVMDVDASRAAWLSATNLLILALFWWLRAFGQAAPPSMVAKFAVWFSATSIMAILTWSMTTKALLLSKIFFCVLAVLTSVGSSYFIFFSPWQPSDSNIPTLNACLCFCLIFVLFNAFALFYKAYEANILTDRMYSVIFEFTSWFASILLFWCIAVIELAPHNSAIRERMKIGVWALATILAAMVVSKVVDIFPWPMKYVAWAMVVVSSYATFFAFFIQNQANLGTNTLDEVHVSSE